MRFDWAERILANGPLAVQATKESVIRGMEVTMIEAYKIESALSQMVFTATRTQEGATGVRREAHAELAEQLSDARGCG